MRNTFVLLSFLLIATFASAQEECATEEQRRANPQYCGAYNANRNQNGNQNSNQQANNNIPYIECQNLYSSVGQPASQLATPGVLAYYVAGVKQTPTPNGPILAIPATSNENLRYCKGLEAVSARMAAQLRVSDSKRSQDGKISCVRKSGITADWESCSSAVGMYDSIIVAEAAMQIFQGVQTNRVEGQAQNEALKRTASGDGQNAMYDAQTASLNNAKALNQQQAAAYAAAVAALYAKIQTWIKEDKNAFAQKGCGQAAPATASNNTAPVAVTFTPPSSTMLFSTVDSVPKNENCAQAAAKAFDEYRDYVFANRDAKAALTRAAFIFAAKAIKAGIKANQLGDIAKKVQEAKKATEDPYNPATFEYCAVNRNDPKCAGSVTRTSGSGLQDGGFGIGDSFGNNAFGPSGEEDKLETDPLAPLAGNDTVADVSNPFAEDAKKASGILDPASAASLSPGQAGGGGGGGGAPGGGGGSASLGNDVPGVDESNKESDIKANKADGKYSDATGSGGFQAIKPVKEENPFANLFGGQSGDKMEEDRSIASGDIDGQDSGIFAKISKRYGQVQADKRIEAKNLDE